MTASLVAYRHTFDELRPLLEAVVASCVERLTVVDNSSSPELEAALRGWSDKVTYRASANIGFGAAHNLALREAMAAGADFHFVVNPDIRLEPDAFARMGRFLTEHPSVGLLMPKTLNVDGSLQHNCKLLPTPMDLLGRYFLPKRWNARRNARFTLQAFDHDRTFEVPYLCGCFLVLRLEALRQVGLFDERFFMYPEDIDLTRRMWSAGWHPTYWPGASVVHAHAAGSYHSLRLFAVHCWNLAKYFTKWGWLFDAERTRVNRAALALLKEAR